MTHHFSVFTLIQAVEDYNQHFFFKGFITLQPSISCQLRSCYFEITLSLSPSLTVGDPGIDVKGIYHSGPPDSPAARLM